MTPATETDSLVLGRPGTRFQLPPPKPRWRRAGKWIALGALVSMLLGGFAVWWFVLRHEAPAAVSLDQATAGVSAAAAQADAGDATIAPTPTTAAGSQVSGTWRIDRTITNASGTGTFAGFRVNEQLVGIGAATAVGRSPSVEGTVTVEGTKITAAQFSVDLTDITSNDSRRDRPIQQALATSRFPSATFVLTQPIDVGSVPAEGQRISVPATGDLTIRGVTKTVTLTLDAELQNNVLVVVGSAPVLFSDYGITAPTAPVVASVDDHGTIEIQLYLTRS